MPFIAIWMDCIGIQLTSVDVSHTAVIMHSRAKQYRTFMEQIFVDLPVPQHNTFIHRND